MGTSYRASVNVQFDITDADILERYLLTPSHAAVLEGLMEGVSGAGRSAHLLIGPYGTGKSLLAAITLQYVSQRFDAAWRKRLLRQAEQAGGQLHRQLQAASAQGLRYVPVIINGKTGSLRYIVNKAIHRALAENQLSVTTPNDVNTIMKVVARWNADYPEAYAAFIGHLEERRLNYEQWLDNVKRHDDESVRMFIALYEKITAGIAWSAEHEELFIEHLEPLCAQLAEQHIGLFVAFDEFGRLLEAVDEARVGELMGDLQDLAEFAERCPNLQLLLISHKHIRQYASAAREIIRDAFEKVEKRFRFYYLETDAATYLQLAQQAAAPLQARIRRQAAEQETAMRDQAASLPLFSGFTGYQLHDGIVRGLYPLHPAAVMLLPRLSHLIGQNERTLYSFYSEMGLHSLPSHVARSDHYYYADELFDFFQAATIAANEFPELQLYHRIIGYVPEHEHQQRRIVKLITLWHMSGLTRQQSASTSFIAFALGERQSEVERDMQVMSRSKLIRKHTIREAWELYDGSSIDLDALISERLQKTSIAIQECKTIVERMLPKPYILPYEYNDDADMLRYADIRLVAAGELEEQLRHARSAGDDRLWLVLYEHGDEMSRDRRSLEKHGVHLIGYPDFTVESIKPMLRYAKVLEALLHDAELLSRDHRLRGELIYIQQETEGRIRAFARQYFQFDRLEWYDGAQRHFINDWLDLESVVAQRMRRHYRLAPTIRNEAFNRKRISSIQRRALLQVMSRLLQTPDLEQLGIVGHGPDYLIYVSVLKNNGYTYSAAEGVQCNEPLAGIRRQWLDMLQQNQVGELSSLVDLLKESPYGVRDAVAPLLFVALLRDRWERLLFYAHDMSVASMQAEAIVEMLQLADSYQYRYYSWSVAEEAALRQIAAWMGQPIEEALHVAELAERLLAWLRALPRFAQITMQISYETGWVRDVIRAAEADPYKSLVTLAEHAQQLLMAKAELEGYMEMHAGQLLERISALTACSTLTELQTWLTERRDSAIIRQSKLLTFEADSDDEALQLNALALHLTGVNRAEWSDATDQFFLQTLTHEWQLLQSTGAIAAASESDSNVPLSGKAQTLYANIKNILKYGGRDIPAGELRSLLHRLLQENESS